MQKTSSCYREIVFSSEIGILKLLPQVCADSRKEKVSFLEKYFQKTIDKG